MYNLCEEKKGVLPLQLSIRWDAYIHLSDFTQAEVQSGLVWFLLFNGISTLFMLFNAKAILLEEQ